MNPRPKRYRQTSIFECFELNKKQKTNDSEMSKNSEIRDLMLAAAEKRISAPSGSGISENKKSVEIEDTKNTNNVDSGASSLKAELKITNEVIATESCSLITDGDQLNGSDNESGFENSGDLFPDQQSSLEDYYIPNSNELFMDEDSKSQTASAIDDDEDDPEVLEQISFLNRRSDCCLPLPKLEPLENHFITFSPYVRPGDAPRPYPQFYRDRWDSDHVRMPCSPMNRYPVEDRYGEKRIESRWDLIRDSLSRDIGSSEELVEAILRYNSQYASRWNFQGLHAFINKHLKEEEQEYFFETMLPAMIKITLNLPKICTQPVPLLKKGRDHYLSITQKQIGCLLLNAFFCTFPRRTLPNRHNRQGLNCEYATYPDINFNRLYAGVKKEISHKNAEKLNCLFNYFRRITTEEPTGTVTFHRQCIPSTNLPKWNESTRGIRTAVIKSSGVIETDGHGMLEVDFANKFVGGGVLGQGCVQEEIRFIICPELIVSRLFVECLNTNEVLIVTGVEQYNKYSGYADDFKFEGNFNDKTPRDSWGRRYTQLVAMDATHFKDTSEQFKCQFITKELNKAYCGFYEDALPSNLPAIATGNWGCGAFKGNPNLKFLIQLMAASETGRSLIYFTFGNKKLKTELKQMYDFLCDQNLAVGDVWRLLINYAKNVSVNSKAKYSQLYDFIFSQFLTKEENCRQQDDKIGETPPLDDSDKRAVEKLVEDVACDGSSTEIEDNIGS